MQAFDNSHKLVKDLRDMREHKDTEDYMAFAEARIRAAIQNCVVKAETTLMSTLNTLLVDQLLDQRRMDHLLGLMRELIVKPDVEPQLGSKVRGRSCCSRSLQRCWLLQ